MSGLVDRHGDACTSYCHALLSSANYIKNGVLVKILHYERVCRLYMNWRVRTLNATDQARAVSPSQYWGTDFKEAHS